MSRAGSDEDACRSTSLDLRAYLEELGAWEAGWLERENARRSGRTWDGSAEESGREDEDEAVEAGRGRRIYTRQQVQDYARMATTHSSAPSRAVGGHSLAEALMFSSPGAALQGEDRRLCIMYQLLQLVHAFYSDCADETTEASRARCVLQSSGDGLRRHGHQLIDMSRIFLTRDLVVYTGASEEHRSASASDDDCPGEEGAHQTKAASFAGMENATATIMVDETATEDADAAEHRNAIACEEEEGDGKEDRDGGGGGGAIPAAPVGEDPDASGHSDADHARMDVSAADGGIDGGDGVRLHDSNVESAAFGAEIAPAAAAAPLLEECEEDDEADGPCVPSAGEVMSQETCRTEDTNRQGEAAATSACVSRERDLHRYHDARPPSPDEMPVKTATALWQDGAMSNLTYILYLNGLAGRVMRDATTACGDRASGGGDEERDEEEGEDMSFEPMVPWVIDFDVPPESSSLVDDRTACMLVLERDHGGKRVDGRGDEDEKDALEHDSEYSAGGAGAGSGATNNADDEEDDDDDGNEWFGLRPAHGNELVCRGWRDLTKSKCRITKGDEHMDATFDQQLQHLGTYMPHQQQRRMQAHSGFHVSDEQLSELTAAVYRARRIGVGTLTRIVRAAFKPEEYPMSMRRMYEWSPDEAIPDFFINSAVFQSIHESMPDLAIPQWAGDIDDFIDRHRAALESDRVSCSLHHWIDLTFGYRLSGVDGLLAKNIPRPAEDPSELRQRGVVQLFRVPHPPRRTVIFSARGDADGSGSSSGRLRIWSMERSLHLEATAAERTHPRMEGNVGKIQFEGRVSSADVAVLGLEIETATAAFNVELNRLHPWSAARLHEKGQYAITTAADGSEKGAVEAEADCVGQSPLLDAYANLRNHVRRGDGGARGTSEMEQLEAVDISRLGKIAVLLFAPHGSASFLPDGCSTCTVDIPMASHVQSLVASMSGVANDTEDNRPDSFDSKLRSAAECIGNEIFTADIRAACSVFARLSGERPGCPDRLAAAARHARFGHMGKDVLGTGALRLCAFPLLTALEDAATCTGDACPAVEVGEDIELIFTLLCERIGDNGVLEHIVPFLRRLLERCLAVLQEKNEKADGVHDTEEASAISRAVDYHQFCLQFFFGKQAHGHLVGAIGLDLYMRELVPIFIEFMEFASGTRSLVSAIATRIVDAAANVSPPVVMVHVLCPAFSMLAFAADEFIEAIALLISKIPASSEAFAMAIFLRLLSSIGQRAIDALNASASSSLSVGATKLCQMLRPFLRFSRCIMNVGNGGVAKRMKEKLLRSEVSTVLISSLLSPNAPPQLREASAKCILAVCRTSKGDDSVMNDAMALFAPFFAKCAEPECSDEDLNLLVVTYPDLTHTYGSDVVRLVTPDWQVLEAYIDSTATKLRGPGGSPAPPSRGGHAGGGGSGVATPEGHVARTRVGADAYFAEGSSPLRWRKDAEPKSPIRDTFMDRTARRFRPSFDGSIFAKRASTLTQDSGKSSRGVSLTPEAIHGSDSLSIGPDSVLASRSSPDAPVLSSARIRENHYSPDSGSPRDPVSVDDEWADDAYDIIRKSSFGSPENSSLGPVADWAWYSPAPYVDAVDAASSAERIERSFGSPDIVPWMMDAMILRSWRAHPQMRPVRCLSVLDGESYVASAAGRIVRVSKLANNGTVTEYGSHLSAIVGVTALQGDRIASCDVSGCVRIWNAYSGRSLGESFLLSQSQARAGNATSKVDAPPNTIEEIESNDQLQAPGANDGIAVLASERYTGAGVGGVGHAFERGGTDGSPISLPAGLIPASTLPSCTAFSLSSASNGRSQLLAGTADGRVKVLDCETQKMTNTSGWRCVPFRGQASEPGGLRIQTILSKDFGCEDRYGHPVETDCHVVGLSSGYISVVDPRGGRIVSMIKAHEGGTGTGSGVLALAAGPATGQLVSSGADRKIVLWDLRMSSSQTASTASSLPPTRLAVWKGHKDPVQSILVHGPSIISFGGARMGVSSTVSMDAVQQLVSPVRLRSSKGSKERGAITTSAILPCSRALICGTDDGIVRLVR